MSLNIKCHFYELLPSATNLGQGNVFTGVCDSVNRGEAFVVGGGRCVWFGGCVWFFWGACMVFSGVHGFFRGCAWFFLGRGVHVFFGGTWFFLGGVVFLGGCACFFGGAYMVLCGDMHRIHRDMVNEQAVCILLECILVIHYISNVSAISDSQILPEFIASRNCIGPSKGSAMDVHPSLGVQILSFSCSFQPKICKIILIWELVHPLRENLGSATGLYACPIFR